MYSIAPTRLASVSSKNKWKAQREKRNTLIAWSWFGPAKRLRYDQTLWELLVSAFGEVKGTTVLLSQPCHTNWVAPDTNNTVSSRTPLAHSSLSQPSSRHAGQADNRSVGRQGVHFILWCTPYVYQMTSLIQPDKEQIILSHYRL